MQDHVDLIDFCGTERYSSPGERPLNFSSPLVFFQSLELCFTAVITIASTVITFTVKPIVCNSFCYGMCTAVVFSMHSL